MSLTETHVLITQREALKILTWVTASGLAIGAYRTDELTRFPAGKKDGRNATLYSRQECEALRDSIIAAGNPQKRRFPKRAERKNKITELV